MNLNISIWVTLGLLLAANFKCKVWADETTSETETTIVAADSTTSSYPVIERSSHLHVHTEPGPTFKGLWKKNVIWQPRWVKTWKEKKIYVAVWKRVWGPIFVKEYLPVPKPPPGWIKHKH